MKRNFRWFLSVLIVLAWLAVFFCLPARGIHPAQAAARLPDTGIVVNTLEDELNSDGDCSLREAVEAANTNTAVDACPAGGTGTDTITFSVAGTITVTSQLEVTAGGPLVIAGGEGITTSGGGTTRVWYVETGSDLTLQNLSVVDGYSSNGAGLFNYGNVTILRSAFSGNQAFNAGGGGIYNMGILTITNSTFSGNLASGTTSHGGGIRNSGTLSIAYSTFSGNSASSGGGIYGGGGGVYGSAILTNTIVANSPGGGDCSGIIIDGGYNLSTDDTCSLDLTDSSLPHTDPLLGPLQDNGGPTWTHALLWGSPAIDARDNTLCPFTDQRGFYRPFDGSGDGIALCDIGSFEYNSFGMGVYLFPPNPHGDGVPGTTVTYRIELINLIGITDSYNLTLGTHAWETTLSADLLGPIPPDSSQAFTVTVTIPPEAVWYQADTVIITATSVAHPTENTASAPVTTQAYAPPQISIDPPSLESIQSTDQIVTLPLTINNGNGVTLTYDIRDMMHPVLWMHMDESAGANLFYDSSGNSYHGSCTGESCPQAGVPGKVGTALNFDCQDDYIQLTPFELGGAMSISVWEKRTSIYARHYPSIDFTNGPAIDNITLSWDGFAGSMVWQIGRGRNGMGIGTSKVYPENEWVHVAAVVEPDGFGSIYWNGDLIASGQMQTPLRMQRNLQYIGKSTWDKHAFFYGELDELMIFNYALNEDEVLALYQEGYTGDVVPWLSVDPVTGTIPTNTSQDVTVTLDSTDLELGVYTANLYVAGKNTGMPVVTIPVTMTVAALSAPTYLPLILKEQQAINSTPGTKVITPGSLAAFFGGGLGAVLWLRRKYKGG